MKEFWDNSTSNSESRNAVCLERSREKGRRMYYKCRRCGAKKELRKGKRLGNNRAKYLDLEAKTGGVKSSSTKQDFRRTKTLPALLR
jgi:hypothetical protein